MSKRELADRILDRVVALRRQARPLAAVAARGATTPWRRSPPTCAERARVLRESLARSGCRCVQAAGPDARGPPQPSASREHSGRRPRSPRSAPISATASAASSRADARPSCSARATRRPASCSWARRPGADEDEQGLAFVGRAGQLLTDIIEKGLKIPRPDVFIANVIKCRPPQNRNPEPDEILSCQPFLEEQIRAIRPEGPGRPRQVRGAVAPQDGGADLAHPRPPRRLRGHRGDADLPPRLPPPQSRRRRRTSGKT